MPYTLTVDITPTHSYTFTLIRRRRTSSVPTQSGRTSANNGRMADKISLATLIPVRRRSCCWSGDQQRQENLHSPLRLVEKFTRLLVRRCATGAQVTPKAHKCQQRQDGGQVTSRLSRDAQVPPEADRSNNGGEATFNNINLIKNQSF
jgi:hypothetical protein